MNWIIVLCVKMRIEKWRRYVLLLDGRPHRTGAAQTKARGLVAKPRKTELKNLHHIRAQPWPISAVSHRAMPISKLPHRLDQPVHVTNEPNRTIAAHGGGYKMSTKHGIP